MRRDAFRMESKAWVSTGEQKTGVYEITLERRTRSPGVATWPDMPTRLPLWGMSEDKEE